MDERDTEKGKPTQTISGSAIINELRALREEQEKTNKLLTNILTQVSVAVSSFNARQQVAQRLSGNTQHPQPTQPQQSSPAMANAQRLVQQYAEATGQQAPVAPPQQSQISGGMLTTKQVASSPGISGLDDPAWMNEGVPIQNP